MSLAQPVRNRIEELITGDTGTTRTMVKGRFRRRPSESDALGEAAPLPPQSGEERMFEVAVGMPTEMDPVNPLDNFALYDLAVTIRVLYAHTAGGGDMTEGNTTLTGSATMDAIRDRAATDVHDILGVLTWYENLSGVSPDLYDLHPMPGQRPDLIIGPQTAVLSIPYRARIRATVPGAYAP